MLKLNCFQWLNAKSCRDLHEISISFWLLCFGFAAFDFYLFIVFVFGDHIVQERETIGLSIYGKIHTNMQECTYLNVYRFYPRSQAMDVYTQGLQKHEILFPVMSVYPFSLFFYPCTTTSAIHYNAWCFLLPSLFENAHTNVFAPVSSFCLLFISLYTALWSNEWKKHGTYVRTTTNKPYALLLMTTMS